MKALLFVPLAITGWEWVIIALVALLLLGGKKIPEFMKGLGKGVKSFKEGMKDVDNDVKEIKKELRDEPKDESK
ncbi:MAG: twin-arginine translocase TatA/TatE family subunit [Bacteroidales bacterium]|nr:twin-arginine translocase TatA/TatE family subunit [Bacteroidales bacterium]